MNKAGMVAEIDTTSCYRFNCMNSPSLDLTFLSRIIAEYPVFQAGASNFEPLPSLKDAFWALGN